MGNILVLDNGDLTRFTEAMLAEGRDLALLNTEEDALSFAEREEVSCGVINLEATERRLGFLEDFLDRNPFVPVIALSAEANVEEAVRAVKLGAFDYRLLRTDEEVLKEIVLKACEERPHPEDDGFLTANPELKRLLERLKEVAKSKATVLITGESGTGKEVLARYLHRHSDRAQGPFVAINCAALPEHLLESELFGYEKGAFSGAFTRKIGKFELANGGTILLDEVTEMPLSLQAKLLRVLQEGEVDRLGGAYPVKIDVRVIATTNRDVAAEVKAGRFREDLYFRLNVIPVHLPPLRERPEDIKLLAEHFRREFAKRYGRPVKGFAEGVLERLQGYHFPGNVRELRNLVERAVLLARGPWITFSDLFPHELSGLQQEHSLKPLKELEREMILKALKAANGNRTKAAEILGISVRTLRHKLQVYREAGLI
ncbi:MAG: sigma-54-dependent Fis family transcriptional regulator [Thermodesulfobacteria bacterium]|nr:sigma-54-dependent Fis family transcriptional regulator [Thermodesulfobacteriota bacterium]